MIEVSVKELADGLRRITGSVHKSSKLVLETCVLVTVDPKGKYLLLSGRAPWLQGVLRVPVESADPGDSFGVVHEKFLSVISGFRAGTNVKITPKGSDRIEMKVGRSKYKLLAFARESFSTLAKKPKTEVSISSDHFAAVLEWSKHALSSDDTKAHFAGVDLRLSGGTAVASATDGMRAIKIAFAAEGEWSGFVTSRAIPSVLSLCEVSDYIDLSTVEGKEEKHHFFSGSSGGYRASIPVGAGQVDISTVVTDVGTSKGSLSVRTSLLVDALSRLVRLRDESKSVELSSSKSLLKLLITDPSGGDGCEQLPVSAVGIVIPPVWVSSRNLLQAVKSISTEAVHLHYWDAKSAIAVTPGEGGDMDATEVLMPISWGER